MKPAYFLRSLLLLLPALLSGGIARSQSIEREYAVSFSSTVATHLSLFQVAAADTQLTAAFAARVQVYEVGTLQQFVRFSHVDSLRLPLPASAVSAVRETLQNGFLLWLHPSGGIDSLGFATAPGDAAEQLIVQLVEGWQWRKDAMLLLSDGPVTVFAQNTSPGQWRLDSLVTLTNGTGRNTDLLPQYTFYRPGLQYRLSDETRLPAIVSGFLNREARINHRVVSEMKNRYDIRLLQTKTVKPRHQPVYTYRRPLWYPEKIQQVQRERQRERAKRVDIAILLQQLQAVTDSTPERDKANLLDDMKAVLLVNEKPLDELNTLWLTADPQQTRFKLIRAALVTTAHPLAQQWLLQRLQGLLKTDPAQIRYLVASLGLLPEPMPELENAVFALLQHPRVPEARKPGICLSLGNMAGQLLAKDSMRAMALTDRLLQYLADQKDTLLLLSALGNAGTSQTLAVATPMLSSASVAIGAMAYYSLRFVENGQVDSLYALALKDQTLPEEKKASLLDALFYRPFRPSLLPDLQQLLLTGKPPLQLQGLQLLCHYSFLHPHLLQNIRQLSLLHADADFRKSATDFLRQSGG